MRILLLILAVVALQAADEPRPATWAEPVTLAGIENFYRVSPQLYRCAQPDAAGMKKLEALGIKTVINLRALHNDKGEVKDTEILNEELSVKPWHIEDEDVIRVLRIMRDPAQGPFLIHCHRGADRTGVMCAMYRIVVQGWSKDDAIKELTDGGFNFWSGWTNIPRYLRAVDVEKIKAAVTAP